MNTSAFSSFVARRTGEFDIPSARHMNAKMTGMAHVQMFTPDHHSSSPAHIQIEDISEHIHAGHPVWFDIVQPDSDDIDLVAQELGLHELAVEDAFTPSQRPKIDRYANHVFINVVYASYEPHTRVLRSTQIGVFLTDTVMVSIHSGQHFNAGPVAERWESDASSHVENTSGLVHLFLDHIVDSHVMTTQSIQSNIDDIENLLFHDTAPDTTIQHRMYVVRKNLMALRRIVLPMREVIINIMKRDYIHISPELIHYFEDVYDHAIRTSEETDALLDLVSSMLDTYLTMQSNHMNLIMKKVTSWAAIIAVPTAITGFYGRNIPYPGFGQWSGFITSSIIIALLSLGLYAIFRSRDWL